MSALGHVTLLLSIFSTSLSEFLLSVFSHPLNSSHCSLSLLFSLSLRSQTLSRLPLISGFPLHSMPEERLPTVSGMCVRQQHARPTFPSHLNSLPILINFSGFKFQWLWSDRFCRKQRGGENKDEGRLIQVSKPAGWFKGNSTGPLQSIGSVQF
jgi:hypothetical protein